MKLFIDTNIWLSYLSPTSDIDSLKKLKTLITEKKVELVIPSQMQDEYLRRAAEKIEDERKALSKLEEISVPTGLDGDGKTIISKIHSLNKELKELVGKRIENLDKHIEQIEKLVDSLFSSGILIEDDEKILNRAQTRFLKGNPPKKGNDKHGDAIIWETLKEGISDDKLAIISRDPDFAEVQKGKNFLNRLLKKEWEKHSGKEATLYISLGSFINTLEKKNPVSKEVIEKEVKLGVSTVDPRIFSAPVTIFPVGSSYIGPQTVTLSGTPYVNVPNTTTLWQSSGNYVATSFCTRCYRPYTPNTSTGIGICDDCRRNGGAYVIGI